MTDHAKALADALRWLLSTISANDEDGLSEFAEPVAAARKALAAYDAHPAGAVRDTRPDCSSFPIITRPAEATTREKGEWSEEFPKINISGGNDIVKRLRNPSGIGEPSDHQAMRDADGVICRLATMLHEAQNKWEECLNEIGRLRALSTNQQQGAGSELVKSLNEQADVMWFLSPNFANTCREAADALSRAPQPDTVTEFVQSLALGADDPPEGGFDETPPSWAVAEDWHMHGAKCGYCGCWMSIVRPGKEQCDWCGDGRDIAVRARAALAARRKV